MNNTAESVEYFFLFHLLRSHKLQSQIFYQRFDFFVVFRADVSGGFEEGGAMGAYVVGLWVDEVADEPVGDVNVGFAVFGGGVVLEDGADGYLQSGEFREFAGPFFVAVDIGKGYYFAAFQDGEYGLVELGFAAGGKPGVLGHQAGADEGSLFGFDEGCEAVADFNGKVAVVGVFAEMAVRTAFDGCI